MVSSPGHTDRDEQRFDDVLRFEAEALEASSGRYRLRLFVAGSTPRSMAAIANIRRICESFLKGRYELEVIDVYQQPQAARAGDLLAAPTLIKDQPAPERRLVGDMSREDRVLAGLDLRRAEG
jgi:circadian clock protein KaiB